MRERPILFSDEMVRAILEGRKTQTRRVVKWPVLSASDGAKRRVFIPENIGEINRLLAERPRHPHHRFSPFGAPGDRLWVREAWQAWSLVSHEYDEWEPCEGPPREIRELHGNPSLEYRATSTSEGPWRPSIHMPRWASRLSLEVVSVRVERLHDITEEDAKAEGVSPVPAHGKWVERPREDGGHWSARKAFHELWERINGDGSWDENPLVWVIEFRRVEG